MTSVHSNGTLEKKSNAELVAIYNELHPTELVKRFASREAGIKRILQSLAGVPPSTQTKLATPSSTPPKFEPPAPNELPLPDTGVPRKRRSKFALAPKAEIKPHREGTKRARLVQMLTEGATFEEVCEDPLVMWDAETAYGGIRLLHVNLGYGLHEAEDGRIFLVKP